MEFHEACEKLGQMIASCEFKRSSYGYPIEHFIELINDGETPAMALAIVRDEGGYTGKFEYDKG